MYENTNVINQIMNHVSNIARKLFTCLKENKSNEIK
jgi:hypothetical protein